MTVTPISMPSRPGFSSRRWGVVANTQVFISPISKAIQTNALTGDRWSGSYQLPPIKDESIKAEWETFFAKLSGRSGRFYVTPPFRSTPRGAGSGTPVVNGASQTGTSLVLSVPDALNVNNWLMKGDYIELPGTSQLCVVLENANTNGSGAVTLSIAPALRASPTNGGAVRVQSPRALCMLVDDESVWDVSKFGLFEFSFSFFEVWESTQ